MFITTLRCIINFLVSQLFAGYLQCYRLFHHYCHHAVKPYIQNQYPGLDLSRIGIDPEPVF